MGENLDRYDIKDTAKKRITEKNGRTIGVILLDGTRVVGTLEESRPNMLIIKDRTTNQLRDIHRAITRGFMLVAQGGLHGTKRKAEQQRK